MKKAVFTFIVLAAVFLVLLGNTVQAQTQVDQWGATPRGSAWPILNTASTPAGNASMGGASKPAGASLSGGFTSITLNVGESIVAKGTLEFVGGNPGAAYTALRFALTNIDGATLSNRNTTTAMWTGGGHSGYEFTPRSGGTDLANGGGGSGVIWTVNNGNWNSTFSNNGGPIFSILQAPRLAELTKGVYDWAISVTALANGTNEVRFYIQKQFAAGGQPAFWTGGIGIDAGAVTRKFSFISFWTNSDIDASVTGVNLANVTVQKGSPITVTDPPWQAFYVDYWGTHPRGTAWKVVNDSTYLVGDAQMKGASKPSGASVAGGFLESISPSLGKAITVTGQLEYVGGGAGSAYTGLRFGLFYQDSLKLNNRNRDSAAWVTSAPSGATKGAYGYEFTPRSGGTDLANGGGGSGVIWTVNNGNWNSTFSNNGGPIFSILQAPRLAEISQGVYNFAISVMPLADGTNEVRFYIEKVKAAGQQTTYWTGGVGIDKTPVTSKFNFIAFWINNDIEAATSAFKLYAVKVDKGNPITVTTPPWQAYYVDQWGFIGGRQYGWNFIPDPDRIVGNAGIGGTAPNQKWAAIRGGFDPVTPSTDKALLITGKAEFVGGGFQSNALRVGLMYSEQAGRLVIDSAKATLPDSTRWDGLETYTSGYLFVPPSGTSGLEDWAGLNAKASSGAVVNGAWLHNDYPAAGAGNLTSNYTLGSDVQAPANAPAGAGVYNLTVAAFVGANGANDVRFKLAKSDNSYSFTAKLLDTKSPLAAKKFNSINFAVSGKASATALKLTDIKVDYVTIASVPITAYPEAVGGSEDAVATVPMEFGLAQNYPNPFNPSTAISYDIAKPAYVTLRVYDLLGRLVTQLVDATQSPSRYTVQWNPAGLSSGTYLYRIDARYEDGSGTFSAVKKLMYMK